MTYCYIVPAPFNFRSDVINSTAVNLTWDSPLPNQNITNYTITQYSNILDPSIFNTTILVVQSLRTNVSFTVSNLEEGISYNFSIQADLEGFYSDSVDILSSPTLEIGTFIMNILRTENCLYNRDFIISELNTIQSL